MMSKQQAEIIKKPVVLTINVDDFTDTTKVAKEKYSKGQLKYINILDGMWAYIFDDYRRKDNFVKVLFGGKGKEPTRFIYLSCAEFLCHMLFWKLDVVYSTKLKKKIFIDDNEFYDLTKFNSKNYCEIMNNIMEKYINEIEDIGELSYYTSIVNQDFVELSEAFSSIASNTISIWDVIQLMKRKRDFRNCINTELDENKSSRELEMELKQGEARVMSAIIEDKQSALYPYVLSDRLQHNQFTQMFYAVGPRTDIDKTILPVIIKGNFLKGYRNAQEYYIDSITGRDAQIAKYTNVRLSGYLSRKINLGNLSTYIDYNVKDCGTENYLEYFVLDDMWLKSIDKKYMITENNKLKMINYSTDKHLIGKKIRLRSHICCALDHDRVCQTCFGGKSKRVKGTRIGGLPSIKHANPLSKRIMRAKHFTDTKTMEIKSDAIDKYFIVEGSKFFLRPNLPNEKETFIVVNREYIEEIAEGMVDMEEEGIDVALPLDNVIIREKGIDTVIECDGLFLMFTDEVLDSLEKINKAFNILENDSDEAEIPISKLDKDQPIFNMVIITEEVSRFLKQMMKVIDSSLTKKYDKNYINSLGLAGYSRLIYDILEILINSGLSGTSVTHAETVVYQLLRDPEALYKRANFKIKDIDYITIPLSKSILKRDLCTALSFQELKDQITDSDSYFKDSYGIFDNIFKTRPSIHLRKIPEKYLTGYK
jgi:hypothetical protein